jgi:hypothetical protein
MQYLQKSAGNQSIGKAFFENRAELRRNYGKTAKPHRKSTKRDWEEP